MHKVLARQIKKVGLSPELDAPPDLAQWRLFVATIDRVYTEADQDRYTLERALDLSSAEMQQRFAELRNMQGKLLEASRKAGMADVATNLIHNVGNVLNSVNVSAGEVGRLVSSSLTAGLQKSVELLRAQPKPGRFLEEDPRGPKLLEYLASVSGGLRDQRANILAELESLTKNIEHIRAIIAVQQTHAGARGVVERVALGELLDDGVTFLRLSPSTESGLTVVQDYDRGLTIQSDRHKLFQILVNLLSNARHAVAKSEGRPTVTLRASRLADDRVAIEIEDNGVGIPEENLARVFNHGFTTKSDGHGFGLHSSSCFAIELGGALTVRSAGPGSGATFTLVLPIKGATNPKPPEAARSLEVPS